MSMYLSGEVDSIEILYTHFASLINNEPKIRTVLPLQPTGMENEVDEIFKLTSQGGKMVVEVEQTVNSKKDIISSEMILEQDPAQIAQVLVPLFLSSQILRAI